MADEIQGGLDATVPVKANPKGGVSPLGSIAMDPTQTGELLKRMQEMIAERESPLSKVLSGLKDFSAAGSGGVEGPTQAINLRDQQKATEAQELFKMRADMAALRSAQGQQELLKKQYEGVNAPQGGAAPAAGGATTGTSPIPGLSMQQVSTIANNPSVKAELDTLAPNDYAGRLAIIREAAKAEFGAGLKGKYEAAGNKQEPYTIPGIGKNGGDGVMMMTSNEYLEFKATGKLPSGETVSKAAVAATAPSTTAAAKTNAPVFSDPSISITSAKRSPDEQQRLWDASVKNGTPGIQPNGLPVAKPGTSPHEAAEGSAYDIDPKKLTRAGRTELAQKGYYQPLGIDSPHWERIPGLQVAPAVTVPTAAPPAVTVPTAAPPVKAPATVATTTTAAAAPSEEPKLRDYPTKSAYDAAMKLYEEKQKIPVEAASKEAITAAEVSGKSLGELKTESDNANKTIAAAQRVIDMANDPKLSKVMGYMHGNSGRATALAAVPGFAASLVGQGEKFEDTVKQNVFNKDELAALERLDTDATQLGIKYTADMFKGARLGIGLEKLGLKGKGVSTQFLPEVNKLYATLAKDAAEFELKKNDAFAKWKGNDPMKTYSQFLDTPGYDKMRNEERELLLSRYPGVVKVETVEDGQKSTKSGTKYRIVK
jgi:hypothetical protein